MGSPKGSIRVESVTFPAHRCPRCKVVYPDVKNDQKGYAVPWCECNLLDPKPTAMAETVPVQCTVKYLEPPT